MVGVSRKCGFKFKKFERKNIKFPQKINLKNIRLENMKICSFLIIFINIIIAQDPLDFFPFHEGDLWQYYDSNGYIYNKTILSDSVDVSGNHHLKNEIHYLYYPGYGNEFWLVDSLDRVWKFDSYYSEGKFLYWDFRKKYHEWYFCGIDAGGRVFSAIEDTSINSILTRCAN
jgi:hypothetical protein